MAEVFRARQSSLDREVAIKLMHAFLADDPAFRERFEREARNVARLKHPNIVQVYDFEFDNDSESYYMVMELISGKTLKDRLTDLADKRMPLDEVLHIMDGALAALSYAHGRGMIHRDLKSANLMIEDDNRVVMTDFGIAKIVTSSNFTASGGMIGTPAYMAPEQGLGEQGDERTDIYSMGVILFQLLTGKLPFDAESPLAVILQHLNSPVPNPQEIVPTLPISLQNIVSRAMAKDPAVRFQTSDEMRSALEGVRREISSPEEAYANPQADSMMTPNVPPPYALIAAEQARAQGSKSRIDTTPLPPNRQAAPTTASTTTSATPKPAPNPVNPGAVTSTSTGISTATDKAPSRPATRRQNTNSFPVLLTAAVIAVLVGLGSIITAQTGRILGFGPALNPTINTTGIAPTLDTTASQATLQAASVSTERSGSQTAIAAISVDSTNTITSSATLPTDTPIPSTTEPATLIPSATTTQSASVEAALPQNITDTATFTHTPTTALPGTATLTRSATSTRTLTNTATNSPTVTLTATNSLTSTATNTASSTPSNTPTFTRTSTYTRTPTATFTASVTATPSPNFTETFGVATATAFVKTFVAFSETQRALQTPTIDLTLAAATCEYEYRLVAPVQPDRNDQSTLNDFIEPEVEFDREILIRNQGDCDWIPGLALVYVSGDRLNVPARVEMSNTAPVKPGEVARFRFVGRADQPRGIFTATWRLVLQGGRNIPPPVELGFFVYRPPN